MSVPPWVGYVLKHKTNNDPHYEHTLYPPWTTFLVEVSPTRRYFYIRPQGLVRRVVEAEELADADTSIGSFGSRHEARHLCMCPFIPFLLKLFLTRIFLDGAETFKHYPDFTIAKLVFSAIGFVQRPLFFLEIKRGYLPSDPLCVNQMRDYVDQLWDQQNCQRLLYGYLVQGKMITKWTYSLALVPDDDPIEHVSATVDMFTLAGRTFFNDLCQTAADNWN